ENSFNGKVHMAAMEKQGGCEIVCGAFGSTRHSSFESGKKIDLPLKRIYGTYREMFKRERTVPIKERMQMVVILTPNTMHYPIAMSAIDARFPILSEKPFSSNLDEALNLSRRVRDEKLIYGIAIPYEGYPILQKAHSLIHDECAIGNIRKVVVEYQLGWLAKRLETDGHKQASWRTDPRRCGPAGCLVDHASHCFYLAEWLTGLTVSEVNGDLRSSIAGRMLDDDATVMVRFENGARGVFVTSQIAVGEQDGIRIKISGDKGALKWNQHSPEKLILSTLEGKEELFEEGPSFKELKETNEPSPFGYDEAYINALSNCYGSFFEYLQNPKESNLEKAAFATVPNGLRSVTFIHTVLKNIAPVDENTPATKWTELVIPPIPTL
ncbi:MAG: Gfo/Idh/MocA family oxidoreductase, partial [Kiritimatiellae bacterium]|nr:Gfo/Idh/MocA family oxidoreductase [Kiritimatiellia bacterium]